MNDLINDSFKEIKGKFGILWFEAFCGKKNTIVSNQHNVDCAVPCFPLQIILKVASGKAIHIQWEFRSASQKAYALSIIFNTTIGSVVIWSIQ